MPNENSYVKAVRNIHLYGSRNRKAVTTCKRWNILFNTSSNLSKCKDTFLVMGYISKDNEQQG